MKQVQITVLRKQLYEDFASEFLTDAPEECACVFFQEGDRFLYTGGAEMPAGFRRDQSENPAFRSCRNSNSTQTGPLADSREVVTVK